MLHYPLWLQLLIVLVVADILPLTLLCVIGRWRMFPAILRDPLLFFGIISMDRLNELMSFKEQIKEISDYTYMVLGVVFLILAFKNKWFWDEDEHNNQGPST